MKKLFLPIQVTYKNLYIPFLQEEEAAWSPELHFWLHFTVLQLLPKESACICLICNLLSKNYAIFSFK